MTEVNVHEAKTHLSRLLKQVEDGERVVISRGGSPVADLVQHVRPRLTAGLLRGQLHYDSETFDDPDRALARQMVDGPLGPEAG
ncbi:type II toxin-antitoxin system Phd/YefM family antitoxin [Georgenia subflava]|uniref:Antitoxin n=1 Tax=Georgenia subflava TaxID=1622177 RepID=A0A6N7EJC6_9MICO|nr:type II toxin-antitoxin system prevent-host-death family antitoxin [Georgenia subflava]MPV36296.1 type II toxin-antitoxin system prevent-host-death family antitoxin [Georgenia subflava]